MYDISVIVTVFNEPFDSLATSLDSILDQEDARYEIVIADDHSDTDYEHFIKKYFFDKMFDHYQYVRNDKNYKTVGNLLHALTHCSGRYIKELGAGDILYDKHVLSDLVHHCDDNNIQAGFGCIRVYGIDGGVLHTGKFNAPRNAYEYTATSDKNMFTHQLNTADWIPGSAQFYESNTYRMLLKELYNEYEVRYCEDFCGTLALLNTKISYWDRPLIWYEFGVGISTAGNRSSVLRMYEDHSAFYKNIFKKMPDGKRHTLSLILFKIRDFIATRTPIYTFFQKQAAKRYGASRPDSVQPNTQLMTCTKSSLSKEGEGQA